MPDRQGHILIVDDNRLNRIKLAHGLQQEGHTSAMAENGRQALELIQTQPFDLVLLDIVMPEMDGYEVLEHMKGNSQLRDIPVIVISALDEMDSVVKGIKMGAEDYLPKPFDLVLLKARISACLEKKWLRDQELEYLRQVTCLTHAAAAVEAGTFDADYLVDVTRRTDELGQLPAGPVLTWEGQMASENGGSVRCSRLELDAGAPLHQRFLVGRALESP